MKKNFVNDPDMKDYNLISRHLVLSRDLNPFGNVFGGQMLSWLDETSYVFLVHETGYSNFVTVAMEDVKFHAPAVLGDTVSFYGKIINTGRSSATVRNRAFVHNTKTGNKTEIINCTVTFVALKNGRPFPFFSQKN